MLTTLPAKTQADLGEPLTNSRPPRANEESATNHEAIKTRIVEMGADIGTDVAPAATSLKARVAGGKNKFLADAPPTGDNDYTEGFGPGSLWIGDLQEGVIGAWIMVESGLVDGPGNAIWHRALAFAGPPQAVARAADSGNTEGYFAAPFDHVHDGGRIALATFAATPTALLSTHEIVAFDNTVLDLVVNLPNPVGTGPRKWKLLKKFWQGIGKVTLHRNGAEKINGVAADYVVPGSQVAVLGAGGDLYTDGVDWYYVPDYTPTPASLVLDERGLTAGAITTLLDKSGAGKDATQATAGNKAGTGVIGALAAADFDGNDFYDGARISHQLPFESYHIFAVLNLDTHAVADGGATTGAQVMADSGANVGVEVSVSGIRLYHFADGAYQTPTRIAVVNGTTHLFEASYDGHTLRQRIDAGAEQTVVGVSRRAFTTTSLKVGGATSIDGRLHLMLFPRCLTPSEQAFIRAYHAAKYGMAV